MARDVNKGEFDHLLLPEGSNLLHIGPQKTGSTAIQATLHEARADLRRHGVVYPGKRARPSRAAAAGLGLSRPRGAAPARPQAWDRLLKEVAAARDLRVCISHEAFGRADDGRIDEIVAELGGERPHVLAVARRYDSYLPSQWQQRVKAQELRSYEEWLRLVLGENDGSYGWRNVWVPHHTVSLVQRWAARVGPDNVTLLIADDGDRSQLSRLFEGLLGLRPGMLKPLPRVANRSLSYHETELVRQLTQRLSEQGVSDAEYRSLIHNGVIRHLVRSPFPEGDPRIPALPHWAMERVVELSDRRIEGLRDLDIRIVGDLELLRVDPGQPDLVVPDELASPATISLTTALRALDGMASGARRAGAKGVRKGREAPPEIEA